LLEKNKPQQIMNLARHLLLSILLATSIQLFSAPKISLITCSAGDELYSIFGHSAIRVQDPAIGTDIVYNYGMFSYNTDNFLYKFVKGETYYWLGKESFHHFIHSYKLEQRAVFENELNIDIQDARKIQQFLARNAQPENAVYLYSYMFDNCATRIRDVFGRNAGDSVHWHSLNIAFKPMPKGIAQPDIFAQFYSNHSAFTYRDLLNIYLQKIPWVNWGIYFSVAAPSDKSIPYEDAMFLPEFLLMGCNNACYFKDGKRYDLLKKTNTLISPMPKEKNNKSPISPFILFSIIAIITGSISYVGYRQKKWFWGMDSIIFLLSGLYGSTGAFVSWISIHPATFPNYNMLWSNPVQLLWAFLIAIPLFRKRKTIVVLYSIFFALLAIYSFTSVIGLQAVHWANIPFICILASRMVLVLKLNTKNE